MPSTDPMNASPGAPIRLCGPAEIAAAVPVLLGYHPDGDTMVMVCLNRHGDALRLGPLAGIPLPGQPLAAPSGEVVAGYLPPLRALIGTSSADAVLLIVYTTAPGGYAELALTLADVLHGTATEVLDVLHVTSGSVGSYHCPDQGVVAVGGAGPVAAAAAMIGRSVLPSRRDIAHAIDPDHTGHPLPGGQLTDATADATRLCRTDPGALAARAEQLYTDLLHRADHGGNLPDDHAADLLAALAASPTVRDHIAALAVRDAATDRAPAATAALTGLAGRTPHPHAAPICTVLAMTAYRTGDGTLANVALDRALTSDPDYPLAHLLGHAITQALPPAMLDHVTAASP